MKMSKPTKSTEQYKILRMLSRNEKKKELRSNT